ncbi:MAG: hypothetical protein QXF82_07950 [Nitrososphaeria archaeon]
MENTNCGENCPFVKSGFIKSDKECPHFIQTIWQQEGNPTPKIVSDCYPKKFAAEQNMLLHRFLAMQSVTEELRNKIHDMEKSISQLCDILSQKITEKKESNYFLDEKESYKKLE